MDIKRGKSLYMIFLGHLISFCILSIIWIFLLVVFINISVSKDIIKPANYMENQVEKLKLEANQGLKFDSSKIPYSSKYIFFDNKNKVVKANTNEEETKNINKYLNGEKFSSKYVYNKITFKDGTCIIGYDIKAHFTSKILHDLIPYPEKLLIVVFLTGFIFIALIIAIRFGKKLKKELYPLKLSTEKIMNQDLDFEVKNSDVKEFNEVLISISNMKRALKESLMMQWHMEKEKKNQICALAHDIKTPITIIKGNAELLKESQLCQEDREFTDYIINNADKVEKYISILIDISKSSLEKNETKEAIDIDKFVEELKRELYALCSLKSIAVSNKMSYKTKIIIGNKELLMRAIVNIISNAVDYSPTKSEIEFVVNEKEGMFIFTIRDSGRGFTEGGLKNATSQFYMEANERKVGEHYGMGLYIAESVAKKHGGFVILKNREDKVGAEVSLMINTKV